MIVIAADDTGTRHLMDREALAQWLALSDKTIRRHCTPVKEDPETGRKFYDAEACREQLATIRPRAKRCADGRRRAHRD